jgi:hypothetical protein
MPVIDDVGSDELFDHTGLASATAELPISK